MNPRAVVTRIAAVPHSCTCQWAKRKNGAQRARVHWVRVQPDPECVWHHRTWID